MACAEAAAARACCLRWMAWEHEVRGAVGPNDPTKKGRPKAPLMSAVADPLRQFSARMRKNVWPAAGTVPVYVVVPAWPATEAAWTSGQLPSAVVRSMA